jgi:hypothetical protein
MNAELAEKMARRRAKSVVLSSSGGDGDGDGEGDEDAAKAPSQTWDVKKDLEKMSINVKGMASGFKGTSGVESAVRRCLVSYCP